MIDPRGLYKVAYYNGRTYFMTGNILSVFLELYGDEIESYTEIEKTP